jgi:ribonuclease P/MRP protein subunit RPP20
MFLLNLKSITRWLVMTEFEMLMNLIGLFIFSILLHLKFDHDYDSILTWRHLFIPLWLVDGLSLYFCIIVFLRQLGAFFTKEAAFRLFISFFFLASRFVAKLMIYQMLNTNNDLTENKRIKFQYASVPIFFHLVVLMLRSCRLHKYQVFH